MPFKAPRICGCGRAVPYDQECACQRKGRLERNARHDARRPNATQRGYDSRWRRDSKTYLAQPENRVCFRCGNAATVVHHAMPHRGNQALFWNRANWRPACKPCHDGPLQAEEKRGQ